MQQQKGHYVNYCEPTGRAIKVSLYCSISSKLVVCFWRSRYLTLPEIVVQLYKS